MNFDRQRAIYDRTDNLFESILRSGRALSTTDWTLARGILQENESLTQNYETAIRILKQNHHTISSLFAPIRRIPPEVLSHIFAYPVQSNHFGTEKRAWSSDASKLGKACHYWRLVSSATPQLWAKLDIELDFKNSMDLGVFRDLKHHIERAQSVPMDIALTIDGNDGDLPVDVLDVLEALFASSSQWYRLECNIGEGWEETAASILLDYSAEKLASLRCLEIAFGDGVILEEGVVLLNLFMNKAPLLRSIRLPESRQYIQQDTLGQHNILFTAITDLFIGNTTHVVLSLLGSCPNLVSAHYVIPPSQNAQVDESEGADSNKSPKNMRRLLRLRDLTIQIPGACKSSTYPLQNAAKILQHLACPALEELAFLTDADSSQSVGGPTKESSFLCSLTDFLARSQGPLHLRLDRIPFSDEELVSLLGKTPSLTSLTIRETEEHFGECKNVIFSDLSFAALTWPDSTSKRSNPGVTHSFPLHFRSLAYLRITIDYELYESNFVQLVKSRLIEGQPTFVQTCLSRLQSFYVKAMKSLSWDGHEIFVEYLRELKKEDLAIRVVTHQRLLNGTVVEKEVVGLGEYEGYSHDEEEENSDY
uniref:Uncharacterized protein n=1 Tax=Moniliophthora roreri TaxID=221103 RepID=A0A0W0G3S8_MONRR